jgi:hypothetical protein
MASLIAPDRLAATGSIPGWTEGQLSHAAGALAFLWHPGRHALCRSPSGAAVLARCDGLIELREAVRRAKTRLAWVPWLSLLPRLATKAPASDDSGNGGNGVGMAAATPAPPVRRHRRRRLVPGAEQLRQSEEALATAKVFLAAVAKDGAAVVRTNGSEAAARCVLQLLEAERHALLLVLLRHCRFPLPPVGGDASDVQLVERSMLASVLLGSRGRE